MQLNLRPISHAVDFTGVIDGLWLGRCKHLLENQMGSNQMGGRFDAVANLILITVLVQLRDAQGFHTYLLEADAKSAFDVTNHFLILVSAYLAGVVGHEW